MLETTNWTTDLRYKDMLRRLRLLRSEELQRILRAKPDEICLDTYNYDAATGRYCPIAIALDIPNQVLAGNIIPSQEIVIKMIEDQAGEAWGSVKGIPGEFYRQSRYEDLIGLCQEILNERCVEDTYPFSCSHPNPENWQGDLQNGS